MEKADSLVCSVKGFCVSTKALLTSLIELEFSKYWYQLARKTLLQSK